MPQGPVMSFRSDVSLFETLEEINLQSPWGKLSLTGLTPALLPVLRTLSSGGATEDDLSSLVLGTGDASALASFYYYLERWDKLCLLCYKLIVDNSPLAILVPMTRGFRFSQPNISPDARFRLSRFAYCRREADALVLESPLSPTRMILPGYTGSAWVAELAQPRTYRDLYERVGGLAEGNAEVFLGLLINASLVAEVGEDGSLAEDNNPALLQWEFHDLLFHSRSRIGAHDYPLGGTFRFLGKIPPLPALKPKTTNEVIPLHKPDIEQFKQEDLPFTRVVENRRSIRDRGDSPITAQQLGEFLYRVARVRQITDADPGRSLYYQISDRPYPSAGAAYDLELYVTVNACAGIASGFYHYDPLEHRLGKLVDRKSCAETLLQDARLATGLAYPPNILITLASRFQRLSWKYGSIAYALTLKNVGVLFQTMYLVASAMGLTPCALGSGNSPRFSEAAGLDYFEESSVGEFMLSSARESI